MTLTNPRSTGVTLSDYRIAEARHIAARLLEAEPQLPPKPRPRNNRCPHGFVDHGKGLCWECDPTVQHSRIHDPLAVKTSRRQPPRMTRLRRLVLEDIARSHGTQRWSWSDVAREHGKLPGCIHNAVQDCLRIGWIARGPWRLTEEGRTVLG